jgi:glycerophosphoryl diester phosphodiesterase
MRFLYPRIFVALCFIICSAVLAVSQAIIEPLQALHVAEKCLSRPASNWKLTSDEDTPIYEIIVSSPGEEYLVQVNGVHGRLMKIVKRSEDAEEVIYDWPGIFVVAHRGGADLGPPENTLPAFEKAIEIGAHLIEIDIRQTLDGHLIIMHDSTVNRTTNGQGNVRELTLEEIEKLDAGSWKGPQYRGTKVPTLKQALTLMKGRIRPDLDFKQGDVQKLADLVKELDMADQCSYCSSWDSCRQMVELLPQIKIRPTINSTEQIAELMYRLRPPLINMDWHAVTENNIRRIHLLGGKAFVNCLGAADQIPYIKLSAQAGADFIQTDRPDQTIALLKERHFYTAPKDLKPYHFIPLKHPQLGYPLD